MGQYPIGTIMTIRTVPRTSNGSYYMNENSYNWYRANFEPTATTAEGLEMERADLMGEVGEIDSKLQFLRETKTKDFDEGVYQAYKILMIVKSKRTDITKAEAIAKVMKN